MNIAQAPELTEHPQIVTAKRTHERAWEIAVAAVIIAAFIVGGAFIVPPVVAAVNRAVTALTEIPQFCSPKFPTPGRFRT
jgi:hypothetical protein